MSVTLITTIQRYSGYSKDEKPSSCKAGSTFFEIDTLKTYEYHDYKWIEMRCCTTEAIKNLSDHICRQEVLLKRLEFILSEMGDIYLGKEVNNVC